MNFPREGSILITLPLLSAHEGICCTQDMPAPFQSRAKNKLSSLCICTLTPAPLGFYVVLKCWGRALAWYMSICRSILGGLCWQSQLISLLERTGRVFWSSVQFPLERKTGQIAPTISRTYLKSSSHETCHPAYQFPNFWVSAGMHQADLVLIRKKG